MVRLIHSSLTDKVYEILDEDMNSFSSEPDCESLAPDLSAVTQKGLALVETF